MKHIKGMTDLLVSEPDWLQPEVRDRYYQYLREQSDDEIILIRKATSTGRPLGKDEYIVNLETKLGKILQTKKPGRHKKVMK